MSCPNFKPKIANKIHVFQLFINCMGLKENIQHRFRLWYKF